MEMNAKQKTRYIDPETWELVTVNTIDNTRSSTCDVGRILAHLARHDKELEQIRLNLKPAEVEYEWQWVYYTRQDLTYSGTTKHMTKERAKVVLKNCFKFEEIQCSKREVKQDDETV